MECNLHHGQEVICINDNPNEPPNSKLWFGNLDGLKAGNHYTVKDIYIDYRHNMVCITINEIYRGLSPYGNELGYFAFRFKPIIKKKTDISALQKLLEPFQKQVETV